MASLRGIGVRNCILQLAIARFNFLPRPFVKAKCCRPLLIASRDASCPEHGVNSRSSADGFSRDHLVLASSYITDGLGKAGVLNLKRVSHPEVLANQGNAGHKVILDVSFLKNKD